MLNCRNTPDLVCSSTTNCWALCLFATEPKNLNYSVVDTPSTPVHSLQTVLTAQSTMRTDSARVAHFSSGSSLDVTLFRAPGKRDAERTLLDPIRRHLCHPSPAGKTGVFYSKLDSELMSLRSFEIASVMCRGTCLTPLIATARGAID